MRKGDQAMETSMSHMQFNVAPSNISFYRELFSFLGWQTIADSDGMIGVIGNQDPSLWFIGEIKDVTNDYDGPGMNHLAIGAISQGNVDTTVEYLRGQNVELLFDTPRHRPEFAMAEDQTYYQVMFESPDRILFEVVYTGPKADAAVSG